MASQPIITTPITIIGGGISGFSLALSLSAHSIPSKIYEMRPRDATSSGALMLSPNALRILDKLHIYAGIRGKGFEFDTLAYKNAEHETVDRYAFGGEQRYGYRALRVYRAALLAELRAKVEADDRIEVSYERRFARVVEESKSGVTFALTDGEVVKTELLVGADGIHSKVRTAAVEDVKAQYIGLIAVGGALETAKGKFPTTAEARDSRTPYPLPASFHEPKGAFVVAPQDPGAKECLAGIQTRHPALDRAGWDELANDKTKLQALMKQDYKDWSPLVQNMMDATKPDSLYIWPFHTMPKLKSWMSEKRRIVLIGDSAHAIPPTAGQGASQGFEDAFSFAQLVSQMKDNALTSEPSEKWFHALGKWQEYRQDRVDRVLDLTMTLNKRREPGWKDDGTIDVDWLYKVDIEEDVRALAQA